MYAVSELNGGGDAGRVYSYRFDAQNGTMQEINSQPSGGDDPCYVSADRSGKWVVAGNYSSGTLKAMRTVDGHLQADDRVIRHVLTEKNPEPQDNPHVHATYFSKDSKYLYVPDLGMNKVMVYAFNRKTGALKPSGEVTVEPRGGPRHIVLHPNGKFAYVIEEIAGRVSVFLVNGKTGMLSRTQTISSTADGFKDFAGSADIHISGDGRFLYASNRGQANDIVIFAVDAASGKLTKIANQPVLGIAPRNFTLDPTEKYLLVANMKSDEIVVFERNRETGLLTDTGKRISVPTPVCLTWVSK
jgi:6-phosphogluconolactonase